MTDVDSLLRSYIERFQAGASTDPTDLLDQAEGRDRERLAALIDGYLEHGAPPQRWDADAFEGSVAAAGGRDGRARAGKPRPRRCPRCWSSAERQRSCTAPTLVERLAEALGHPGQEAKVARYYNAMEHGRLEPAGISDRGLRRARRAARHQRRRAAARPARPSPPRRAASRERSSPERHRPSAEHLAAESLDGVRRCSAEQDGLGRGGPPLPRGIGSARRVTAAELEARADALLAEVPDWIWNGESLPVPIEEIADTHVGLLIRDVEDMTTAPGAPDLAEGQSISGLLLAGRGEIWVNADEATQWPPRRRFTIGHELGHWQLHREPGRQATSSAARPRSTRSPTRPTASRSRSRPTSSPPRSRCRPT